MSDKNKELESVVGETGDTTQVDQSKRKFSKAGLVAPVIMTLANRPAWGQTVERTLCQISGFDSLAPKVLAGDPISGVQVSNVSCGVHLSPGHWQGQRHNWPTGYKAARLKRNDKYVLFPGPTRKDKTTVNVIPSDGNFYFVSDVFTTDCISNPNATLYDEVHQGTSTSQYLRHMIGLYLASVNGTFTYLESSKIIAIYNATCNGDTYEVSPGVHWDKTKMETYIDYLMDNHT